MDACFISSGYINWKDAICALKRHKASDAHKAAIEAIVTISTCELTLGLSTFHILPTPLYVTHTYMSKHIHTNTHTHTHTDILQFPVLTTSQWFQKYLHLWFLSRKPQGCKYDATKIFSIFTADLTKNTNLTLH